MIYANLGTEHYSFGMPEKIKKILAYIKNHDFSKISGAFDIESENVSGRVLDMELRTVSESFPETHVDFIDVQVWLSGEEGLGYTAKSSQHSIRQSDPNHDIYFWNPPEGEQFFAAHPGDVMVFFPDDLHRPGILTPNSRFARKVVIKVRVDQI